MPWVPERVLGMAGFAVLRRTMRGSARPGAFIAADFLDYRAAWAEPGALTSMLNWCRALRRSALALRPARIRVPVRVIWGDHDRFLDPGLAEAGLALCDQGEVFDFARATHWVQHEESEEVNRLLVEFLA